MVIISWIFSWIFIDKFIPALADRGTFGDKFGAINALFSGLAFAGVIYAILLQRKELSLQREELVLTRGELEGQKKQLEAQNKTFREQALQNAFFQMLNFHNEIVKSLVLFDLGDDRYEGRECFEVLYKKFDGNSRLNQSLKKYLSNHEFMKNRYMEFYSKYQGYLGHYFRNLYNIIKFIHTNDFHNKKYYTNLIRAQLSVYEMLLLFYNCEYGHGREKFKPFIVEYSLLNNIDLNLLLHQQHADLFDKKAYA